MQVDYLFKRNHACLTWCLDVHREKQYTLSNIARDAGLSFKTREPTRINVVPKVLATQGV